MNDHYKPIDASYSYEDTIPNDCYEVSRLHSQIHVTKKCSKYELPIHLFVSYPDKNIEVEPTQYEYVRYVRMDSMPPEIVEVINSYFMVTKNSNSGNYTHLLNAVDKLQHKVSCMERE